MARRTSVNTNEAALVYEAASGFCLLVVRDSLCVFQHQHMNEGDVDTSLQNPGLVFL